MKTLNIMASAGLMLLGSIGLTQAQTSGTPTSPFPNAAPHEIMTINGVPCRTVLEHSSNQRIPVQCAAPTGMVGMDPATTGSVLVTGRTGQVSGTPTSAFPNAAAHEIRVINGVPCRTVLVDHSAGTRVPVECAR